MRTTTHSAFAARVTAVAAALVLFASPLAIAAPATETVPSASSDVTIPPVDAQTEAFRAALAAKQAELDALEAQLNDLDRELAIAAESYNKAVMDLENTTKRLDATKADLADAELAYNIQLDTLTERARDLYKNGEFRPLDVLLGSKSVTDLLGRIRFLQSLGESDADIAAALGAQRDQMKVAADRLQTEEVRARSLEFEMQARQIEVVLRIRERETLLAATQADLLAMLDAQAAERQKAEAELLRKVLAGVSDAGIEVEPGSPVETALGYHGVPYLWGGATPSGFDCSGLIMYVYQQHGVSLPHYSGAQFLLGEKIAPADLQPGDVVFFGSPVYHVGMYVGGGYFIHAPRTGDFVKLSKLAERSDYAGARRFAWTPRTGPITGARVDPAALVR